MGVSGGRGAHGMPTKAVSDTNIIADFPSQQQQYVAQEDTMSSLRSNDDSHRQQA